MNIGSSRLDPRLTPRESISWFHFNPDTREFKWSLPLALSFTFAVISIQGFKIFSITEALPTNLIRQNPPSLRWFTRSLLILIPSSRLLKHPLATNCSQFCFIGIRPYRSRCFKKIVEVTSGCLPKSEIWARWKVPSQKKCAGCFEELPHPMWHPRATKSAKKVD